MMGAVPQLSALPQSRDAWSAPIMPAYPQGTLEQPSTPITPDIQQQAPVMPIAAAAPLPQPSNALAQSAAPPPVMQVGMGGTTRMRWPYMSANIAR